MQQSSRSILSSAYQQYLPDFAGFLLNHHLVDFLDVSYRLLCDLQVPLLKPLAQDEARSLSNKSAVELLTALSHNNPSEHIQKAIERWRSSQFPKITRNMIVVEDVTLIGFARKLAFMEFMPKYTMDPIRMIELIKEIEKYILEYTSTTFIAFVGIIDERIDEHVKSLEQRTRELLQSNTNLEEFAFVASHDLKEPLRKISVFIDRLTSLQVSRTTDETYYLEKIQASSRRMYEMIDDLLSLSLISGNKMVEKANFQSLLEEVKVTFEQRIEETKAEINSDNIPDAYVVPAQFRQVFQNLMSNSLKFVQPGVKPKINLVHRYLSSQDVAPYNLRPAKKYLELRFMDNGIGFNNEFSKKIFAVFQRLHHKHEYEGTGIGLSICKKVISNHGGIIMANSSINQGATFIIILPMDQD